MAQERKFVKNLTGPGSAAKLRETVAEALRESNYIVSIFSCDILIFWYFNLITTYIELSPLWIWFYGSGPWMDPIIKDIVACQVHPALVKCSRVTRFYVNVSRFVHFTSILSVSSRINWLKGSRTVSCRRRGDGFYWRPRLPGMRQYIRIYLPIPDKNNRNLFYVLV